MVEATLNPFLIFPVTAAHGWFPEARPGPRPLGQVRLPQSGATEPPQIPHQWVALAVPHRGGVVGAQSVAPVPPVDSNSSKLLR